MARRRTAHRDVRRAHAWLPPVQPDVPEVHVRSGLIALDLFTAGVEAEVVADLDPGRVRVKRGLNLLPERLPLFEIGLATHGLQQRVLLGVAPPAGPIAQDLR